MYQTLEQKIEANRKRDQERKERRQKFEDEIWSKHSNEDLLICYCGDKCPGLPFGHSCL